MNTSLLGLPGPALGGICVGLSLLFVALWPSRIAAAGFARTVLRWGHSTAWALLALWFLLRSWRSELGDAVNVLPLLAGLIYAVFIVTLVAVAPRRS